MVAKEEQLQGAHMMRYGCLSLVTHGQAGMNQLQESKRRAIPPTAEPTPTPKKVYCLNR